MIKKLFCTFLLFCFYVSQAWGAMIIQQFTSSGGGGCMSGTYILAWDGDHSSGPDYACHTSGAGTISGANTSLTISSSYGESSTNGSFHDTANERLTWTQTADQYFDGGSAQTLWVRVYISAAPDIAITIFDVGYNFANNLGMHINTQGQVWGDYEGTTLGGVSCNNTAPSAATWVNVAYSWDPTNQDHAVWNGASWKEEANEITTAMDESITDIHLGHKFVYMPAGPADNATYIDKWALVSGYQSSVPW